MLSARSGRSTNLLSSSAKIENLAKKSNRELITLHRKPLLALHDRNIDRTFNAPTATMPGCKSPVCSAATTRLKRKGLRRQSPREKDPSQELRFEKPTALGDPIRRFHPSRDRDVQPRGLVRGDRHSADSRPDAESRQTRLIGVGQSRTANSRTPPRYIHSGRSGIPSRLTGSNQVGRGA